MRIGLTLSGGGARSFAHLGVLKALAELQLSVDIISGTSSGAIVAVLYGIGLSPEEIFQKVTETKFMRLIRPGFSRYGLINLTQLEDTFKPYLADKTFADLTPKVIISATDINRGTTVYFSKGEIIKPLVASSALPFLCQPISYQGHLLVDGGLLNNLPVECLTGYADFTIGVHVNPIDHQRDVKSLRDMVERTCQLAINNNVTPRMKLCNFLIEPPQLKHYRLLSIKQAREMYDAGYEHTMSLSENLLAQLKQIAYQQA
ncbi:patatin-like phospholipase family protein [Adhaeribacter rhizoryzae]|uniref:Patatin-like phospholipase family protein n=1 Tax=Adhaeribacter rhizoryzae TaxID=2607907 RepID=A0A5M6DKC0_9BACT|nr:patatin-like phospholipase family protein [Adhaeribacter rhizoryzae]KAA5547951.1 patatin-like phospholipase family protein [Adhaeribacter rhizoryzae]